MKYSTYVFMIVALLAVPLTAAANDEPNTYMAVLESLNESGVEGTAWVTVTDGRFLTVDIEAAGFETGVMHPQHIHGLNKPKENATCPTLDADTNGDGIVDVVEGIPFYGPIILPLMPFNLVADDGTLDYAATFPIKPNELQPLHKRTIVLHGLTIDGTYVASTPVACGEIYEVE